MMFSTVSRGPEPPARKQHEKRWLCKYDGTEFEVWAVNENEVKRTLCYYGFCNEKKIESITEIEKSPNDVNPIE